MFWVTLNPVTWIVYVLLREQGGGTDTEMRGSTGNKLQALVYDILPSTTAVFSYAIGPRKLSANEQILLVLRQ